MELSWGWRLLNIYKGLSSVPGNTGCASTCPNPSVCGRQRQKNLEFNARSSEMAQWVELLVAELKDLSLIAGNSMVKAENQFLYHCSLAFTGCERAYACARTHTHTSIHTKNVNKYFF